MIEHHIQKDILLRLAKASHLRFSELKPGDLESNAFMYHLKQLISSKYVTQDTKKQYTLTAHGLGYVDTLTLTTGRPRKQPKVVTIVALKNAQGEYLLAKRRLQPSINTWMVPSGKRHFGESPDTHADREVKEQVNAAVALQRRGLLDIRIKHDDVLVTHLIGNVYGGGYDGPVPPSNEKFEYNWLKPAAQALTPGTTTLIEHLDNDSELFFLSLDVKAD